MRMKKAIAVLVIAMVLVPAASLFAEGEITGRAVVERGSIGTLTGTLVPDKDEWELRVGTKLYELHLGQFGHDGKTTSTLREGAQATATGFIYGDHISPTTLVSEGISYRFREEDGRPLWAGQRQGPFAEDRPELDRPYAETRPVDDQPGLGRNREQG